MTILNEISEQLQNGKWKLVKELVQKALDEGVPAQQILNEGLLAVMQVIGEQFKNNEVYIPEVMVAARAMNVGVQVLKPHLSGKKISFRAQDELVARNADLFALLWETPDLDVELRDLPGSTP